MKSNRRSFIKQASLGVAGTTIVKTKSANPEPPFLHHVLFWLRDKNNKEHYNGILRSLKELRKVKEVKFLHVGSPSISDIDYEAQVTDASYTFSYLALFESKKDKENYLNDPLHKKFFNDFKDVISKVTIYDSLDIPE